MLTQYGDDDEETMSKPKIVIEDLGGVPADFDDEAHPEDATDHYAILAWGHNDVNRSIMSSWQMYLKSVKQKNSMFPNTTHSTLILLIPPTPAQTSRRKPGHRKNKCDGPVSATVWY